MRRCHLRTNIKSADGAHLSHENLTKQNQAAALRVEAENPIRLLR